MLEHSLFLSILRGSGTWQFPFRGGDCGGGGGGSTRPPLRRRCKVERFERLGKVVSYPCKYGGQFGHAVPHFGHRTIILYKYYENINFTTLRKH